jgi:sec-independent protein translocase protein TatB
MFDITSSKLLILAIIALLVVGPKDLPILLRTLAKYLGVIRRHANDFRAQLDDALREAELDDLKKEFDSVGHEMKAAVEQGGHVIDTNVESARQGIDSALQSDPVAEADFRKKEYRTKKPADEPTEEPTEVPRAIAHKSKEPGASDAAAGNVARGSGGAEEAAAPPGETQLPEKTGT